MLHWCVICRGMTTALAPPCADLQSAFWRLYRRFAVPSPETSLMQQSAALRVKRDLPCPPDSNKQGLQTRSGTSNGTLTCRAGVQARSPLPAPLPSLPTSLPQPSQQGSTSASPRTPKPTPKPPLPDLHRLKPRSFCPASCAGPPRQPSQPWPCLSIKSGQACPAGSPLHTPGEHPEAPRACLLWLRGGPWDLWLSARLWAFPSRPQEPAGARFLMLIVAAAARLVHRLHCVGGAAHAYSHLSWAAAAASLFGTQQGPDPQSGWARTDHCGFWPWC